jgi:hypothetical protein
MPVANTLCFYFMEVVLNCQNLAFRLPYNSIYTRLTLGLPSMCSRSLQYMLNRRCSLCTTANTYVTHSRALVDDSATSSYQSSGFLDRRRG